MADHPTTQRKPTDAGVDMQWNRMCTSNFRDIGDRVERRERVAGRGADDQDRVFPNCRRNILCADAPRRGIYWYQDQFQSEQVSCLVESGMRGGRKNQRTLTRREPTEVASCLDGQHTTLRSAAGDIADDYASGVCI